MTGGKNIKYNKINNMKLQHGGNGDNKISTDPSLYKPPPINRLPYDVKIFSFLAVMGILIRMIFAEKSKDYATATVYGYSCSLLALLGLLVSSVAISYKNPEAKGAIGFFRIVLKSAMPVILIAIVIGLLLYQNMYFYKQINDGLVSTEYYTWSAMSSSFILIQIVAAIFYMTDMSKKENANNDVKKSSILASLASELSSFILILTVLNIGITGLLQVILKFFSTDG
jgi:hypothetical protein|tara:strand:- start:10 stop:690 length:681 start_codon:yes stop_codon:yes gene_type:complete